MLLKFNDVGWLNLYTTTNKGNNKKNPKQVLSRWNSARCVERSVRKKEQFHDRTFIQRWVGRRGSAAEFPPRSPDLTPPDVYLWGTLKNTVYAAKPQTLEELRDQIEHANIDIPLATIQTVCRSLVAVSCCLAR